MDYEKISDWTFGENKPNSKPNKAKVNIGKMNISIDTITELRRQPVRRSNSEDGKSGQPVRRSKSEDGSLSAVGGAEFGRCCPN